MSTPALHCITCNYDLRTLDPTSNCPECGTPIANSTALSPLAQFDPLKVLRLADAMTCVSVAALCSIVGWIGLYIPYIAPIDIRPFDYTFRDFFRIEPIFTYMAYWFIATPLIEGGHTHLSRWLRILSSAVIGLHFAGPHLYYLLSRYEFFADAVAILVSILFFLQFLRLGRFMNDQRIITHAPILMVVSILSILSVLIRPTQNTIFQPPILLRMFLNLAQPIYIIFLALHARKLFLRATDQARDRILLKSIPAT